MGSGGSRRRSVLVGRRLGDGAGLASLSRLLRRGARLRSRDGGALGRRGGTAGLARHVDGMCGFVGYLGDAGDSDCEMYCSVAEVMERKDDV